MLNCRFEPCVRFGEFRFGKMDLGSEVKVRFERTVPGSEWKLGSVRRFYVF